MAEMMDIAQQQQQQQQQRRIKWATRLEEVLNDFDALQLFQSWMGVDDDSSEHPLRLHFAIVAYADMLAHNDARAAQLAREIYNKFLRPRSGLCAFIEPAIRERIGQKLRHHQQQQSGPPPPANLFAECLPPLDTFLRKQHAIFVTSDEFLEKFNASSIALDGAVPCCSSSANSAAPANSNNQFRNRRAKRHEQQQQQQTSSSTLTADTLFRSQKDREAVVPGGAASQRLFKPVSKFPYIGQAQPSKNDSAVSSTFSSEANNNRSGSHQKQQNNFQHVHAQQRHTLRMMREEQRRVNPSVGCAFPRLEYGHRDNLLLQPHQQPPPSSQIEHCTVEGRQKFAEQLQRKLRDIERRHQQEASVNEQIDKLARQQKDSKTTARELIAQQDASDTMLLLGEEDMADAAGMEADEDLDIYCRRKMAVNDSNWSATDSAQQSPLMPLSRRTAARRRSWRNGSGSPSTERVPATLEWATGIDVAAAGKFGQVGTAKGNGGAAAAAIMSQSCCIATGNPSAAASSSLFMMAGRAAPIGGGQSLHPASVAFNQYPLLDSAERVFLPFSPSSFQHHHHQQQQQQAAFGNLFPLFPGQSPFAINPPANLRPHHQQHPSISTMCQSMHLGGIIGSGGGAPSTASGGNVIPKQLESTKHAFGMPPASKGHQSATYCCDNDGDTSGIGSMSSATHSGTSAPGTMEQRERQRAAVFRKARELSSGGGGGGDRTAGTGNGGTLATPTTTAIVPQSQKQTGSAIGAQQQQQLSGIPRQKRAATNGQQTDKQQQQQFAGQINRPSRSAALPPFSSASQQQQSAAAENAIVGGLQQSSADGAISMPKMTISYRDSNGDGVPVVAHVPARPLTFREFRRHLSISNKDQRQFFFKVACEDGSAPYQLLLINDNGALVPQFQGKVSAECRAPLSDSD